MTQPSIQSCWRAGTRLSLPTQDTFPQSFCSAFCALGCSSAAHGELWPRFHFMGVTFKLSVTSLSLEFFIVCNFCSVARKAV